MIKWLLYVLIPLAILTFLTAVVPEFTSLLPYLYISQCNTKVDTDYYHEINSAMFTFCISQFSRNVLLYAMIFLLREVDDTFNITKELRWVVGISCFF